jgi:hypothetical protein
MGSVRPLGGYLSRLLKGAGPIPSERMPLYLEEGTALALQREPQVSHKRKTLQQEPPSDCREEGFLIVFRQQIRSALLIIEVFNPSNSRSNRASLTDTGLHGC